MTAVDIHEFNTLALLRFVLPDSGQSFSIQIVCPQEFDLFNKLPVRPIPLLQLPTFYSVIAIETL